MATTSLTNQFKVDVLNGAHNFTTSTGLVYKFLLIKAAPTGTYNNTLSNVGTPGAGSPTTVNVGTDETAGTAYVSGGFIYTAAQNTSAALFTNTACASFSVNPNWTTASFTATSGVLYTSSAAAPAGSGAGRTVGNYDFGGPQTVSTGTFTVTLPTVGASGLITIS